MTVQWYPGHMHRTSKAIAERMAEIDVVIELLDARLPGSSANPLLARLRGDRPVLMVLNKQDLADPARTALWLDWYRARTATGALALDAAERAAARLLIDACRALAPGRHGLAKPLRVLICGIPNVGKSTLVNALCGRRMAKTGDEAGITRMEQRILLADDFYLFDTPGMLWPKIEIERSGYFLAASGAIGRNAYDDVEVALELLDVLRADYPERLAQRFGLAAPVEVSATPADQLLTEIGRRRGALQSGGRVDEQKAAERVLADFRSGALGRVTLETPERFVQWQAEADRARQEREAQRAERRQQRHPRQASSR
ncbi:ribosome biogenesis GTPase A [Tibeticola sediminis]|jgi:ribosome biogenesis GTPase A|uniref:Ribosome biogenesis GTPase A n=1 Tax=Tibeticola sediminis TaxID=1917811 RepID=A0A3N4UWC3_9BURK|nr:ribosome biogenesis GTPase YlqF [Tibeticola sediminis]RPE65004.1 ribosome biogenesis GTPase A [Tibeticola sediminis]